MLLLRLGLLWILLQKKVLKKRKFRKNDIVEVEEVAKGKDGVDAKKNKRTLLLK